MTAYRISATLLPDGEGVEDLWAASGLLTRTPQPEAEDLPGRFAVAGLVDAHAHLTIDMSGTGLPVGSDALVRANLAAQRAAGVLLVRDIGRVRDEPLEVAVDEPDVAQAGRFLGPAGGWVPELHVPTPPDRLLDTVHAQLRSGVSWIKVVGDWKYGDDIRPNYETALLSQVAEVTRAGGARLAVHAIGPEACRAAVEVGADSVEHGCTLAAAALQDMARQGIAWTPTLSAVSTPPPPDAPPSARARWQGWVDNLRELLPRAQALGVPILAGTDTAAHGTIAREVTLLMEYGLDPVDALRCATTTARTFLGAMGIAEGAPADLVTFDIDPRVEPAALKTPAAVLRRGVRVV